MPVASPYAVFRASDLVWAGPPPARPRALELSQPLAAATLAQARRRPRKRLAPVGVIQGELFAHQPG